MEPSDPTDQPTSPSAEPSAEQSADPAWTQPPGWAPVGSPAQNQPLPPNAWNPPPPIPADPVVPTDYAPPVPSALPGVKIRRPRGSSTVVAWAMIAEVVLIAAVGNQWLTKQVEDWFTGRQRLGLTEGLVIATQTYDWRFTPPAHDSEHAWGASLAMLAVVFLVTAAVLSGLTRGGASKGRAFLSALLAVVFATQIGTIVGGLVLNQTSAFIGANDGTVYGIGTDGSGVTNRIARALFGGQGPSGFSFFGSVAFGLVVGLVAMVAAARVAGDVDPRVAALRDQPMILPPSVPAVPPPWTPTGEPSQPDDGPRHSRGD